MALGPGVVHAWGSPLSPSTPPPNAPISRSSCRNASWGQGLAHTPGSLKSFPRCIPQIPRVSGSKNVSILETSEIAFSGLCPDRFLPWNLPVLVNFLPVCTVQASFQPQTVPQHPPFDGRHHRSPFQTYLAFPPHNPFHPMVFVVCKTNFLVKNWRGQMGGQIVFFLLLASPPLCCRLVSIAPLPRTLFRVFLPQFFSHKTRDGIQPPWPISWGVCVRTLLFPQPISTDTSCVPGGMGSSMAGCVAGTGARCVGGDGSAGAAAAAGAATAAAGAAIAAAGSGVDAPFGVDPLPPIWLRKTAGRTYIFQCSCGPPWPKYGGE